MSGDVHTIAEWLKGAVVDIGITNETEYNIEQFPRHVVFSCVPARIAVAPGHPWVRQGKTEITEEDMSQSDLLLLQEKECRSAV